MLSIIKDSCMIAHLISYFSYLKLSWLAHFIVSEYESQLQLHKVAVCTD